MNFPLRREEIQVIFKHKNAGQVPLARIFLLALCPDLLFRTVRSQSQGCRPLLFLEAGEDDSISHQQGTLDQFAV